MRQDKQLKLDIERSMSNFTRLTKAINEGIIVSKLKVGTVAPKEAKLLLPDNAHVEFEIDAPNALVIRGREKESGEPIDCRLKFGDVE